MIIGRNQTTAHWLAQLLTEKMKEEIHAALTEPDIKNEKKEWAQNEYRRFVRSPKKTGR